MQNSDKDIIIYDLETFGLDKEHDRIAQFAAQRYTSDLREKEDALILYCALSKDYLPSPSACSITKITPQFVNKNGNVEFEFAKKIENYFNRSSSSTLICGYNNMSFDNKMINFLFFRNFLEPYSAFLDRSFDVYTLTKAIHGLRSNLLKYKKNEEGKDSLKLENLSLANSFVHTHAHDALSDVQATGQLLKIIREKDNDIYNRYLNMTKKINVIEMLKYASITKKCVYTASFNSLTNRYGSLCVPLASSSNKFYLFNLSQGEDEFKKKCEKIKTVLATSTDKQNILEMIADCTETLKANEAPFICESDYYLADDNKKEENDIISERLEIFQNIWSLNFFSLPYIKKENNLINTENKTINKAEFSFTDNIDNVEGTLYDGTINRDAKELCYILSFADKEKMKNAFLNISKTQYSDRIKKLFTHLIAKNYPEMMNDKIQEKWKKTSYNLFLDYKKRFDLEIQNLTDEELKKELLDYEKEIIAFYS